MYKRQRQAITRAIADQARTIRIPVHMVESMNKLIRVSRQMTQELGREPSAEEIAEKMDMPVDRVREILKISLEPVSLETPIGEEEDSHLGDFIQDNQVQVPAEAATYSIPVSYTHLDVYKRQVCFLSYVTNRRLITYAHFCVLLLYFHCTKIAWRSQYFALLCKNMVYQ